MGRPLGGGVVLRLVGVEVDITNLQRYGFSEGCLDVEVQLPSELSGLLVSACLEVGCFDRLAGVIECFCEIVHQLPASVLGVV